MAVPSELERRIAPQALPVSGGLALLALGAVAFGFPWVAAALALLAAANAAFFRNPRRVIPPGESLVVSPADGRVVEVAEVEDPGGFVGRSWRIAIFLSILDVHVNRIPISGKVLAVRRRGARFLAAFNDEASRANVQSRMDIEGAGGFRASVVQITGLIARRIVCYPKEGETVVRGEPYGLICYGSRVEVYLPAPSRIEVRVGDRVSGGSSVLAEVRT
jgi:phosphatidylserine decarboxylase